MSQERDDEDSLLRRLHATLVAQGVGDTWAADSTIEPRAVRHAADASSGSDETLATDERDHGVPSVGGSDLSVSLPTLPRIPVQTDETPAGAGADLRIRSTLGEGGMGIVQLARQHSLDRDVALKRIKPGQWGRRAVDRLLAEARITGRLEHPNVVPIHTLGRDDDDKPVLVMKRVEGAEWRSLIHDPDHPAWQTPREDRLVSHLEILAQVCNAVHFAHSRGIVHRDIKPENVMIGAFGEVYLLDWGIGTRIGDSEANTVVGTPCYMSPEMVTGGTLDARTDVYLLGACLHEVLTGQARHRGEGTVAVLRNAALSEPCEHPDTVPEELVAICQRATARDPDRRYQTAQALREAIADFFRHRGSRMLAREAHARLDELRQLIASADAPQPGRIHRLFDECRFGFQQALAGWGDNTDAVQGRRACIELMAEYELDALNAVSAAALLEELESPPAELLARLDALRERLAKASRAEEDLREIERQHDTTVSASQRARVAAGLGTVIGVAGIASAEFLRRRGETPEPWTVFYVIVVAMVVLAFVTFRGRKAFLRNLSNRRIVFLVAGTMSLIGLHRLLLTLGGATIGQILTGDVLIAAAATGVASLTIQRWFAAVAVCSVLAAMASGLFPAFALHSLAAGSALGLWTLALIWWRQARG